VRRSPEGPIEPQGGAQVTNLIVGHTVGQNAPVDGGLDLLLPLVSLRHSMAEVPVTGGELPLLGTTYLPIY
jgi:hypothetical protein